MNKLYTLGIGILLGGLALAQNTPFKFGIGLSGLPGKTTDLAVSAESRMKLADFLSFSLVGDLNFGSSQSPNYYLRLLLNLDSLYFGPSFTFKGGPVYGATAGLNLGQFYLEGQANFPAANQDIPRFAARAGLMVVTDSLLSPMEVLSPRTPSVVPSASTKPGQVWNISSSNDEVYVSVWDNQCEDGDIITVSLGSFSTTVELKNQPATYTLGLSAGTHRLRIMAVNGSGNKGQCSSPTPTATRTRFGATGKAAPAPITPLPPKPGRAMTTPST